MGGGGGVLAPTLTLSTVVWLRAAVLWLVTAIPTYALDPIVTLVLVKAIHVEPSLDTYAVKVLPLRARRTQTGSVEALPAMKLVAAPVDGRAMNSMSPVGR